MVAPARIGTSGGISLTTAITAPAGWGLRVTIASWMVSRRVVDRGAIRTVWRAPAVIKWQERVTSSVGVLEPYTIPARKRIARERIPRSERRGQPPISDAAVGFRQHFAAFFTPDVYLFTF